MEFSNVKKEEKITCDGCIVGIRDNPPNPTCKSCNENPDLTESDCTGIWAKDEANVCSIPQTDLNRVLEKNDELIKKEDCKIFNSNQLDTFKRFGCNELVPKYYQQLLNISNASEEEKKRLKSVIQLTN